MSSGAWFGLGGIVVGILTALVAVIYRGIGQRIDRHEEDDDERFKHFEALQNMHHKESSASIQQLRDGQQQMIGVMLVMATGGAGANPDRMITAISNMLQHKNDPT